MRGQSLYGLSATLFVPAWFVTAAHTSGDLVGGNLAGWQAFVFAFSPIAGSDIGYLLVRLWMMASALSNVVLIGTLVLGLRRPHAVKRTLVHALAAAFLVNACWLLLPDMRADMRVGYYLWLAAFALAPCAANATIRERARRPIRLT